MTKRIFMLLAVLLLVAMQMPVSAQSISSASLTYTFNGQQSVLNCPAMRFAGLDLTDTKAENFKIDGVEVQVSGNVTDVYIVAGEYKDGTSQSDVEINYVPLTSNGKGGWQLDMGNKGWIVENNNRSTGYRNFRFYFVANKDSDSPIYYDNAGAHYIIRFYAEDGGSGGGGGGESGSITFYDSNTATLNLLMTGGWNNSVTYTYGGSGERDIKDNPGQVSSLQIGGFTLRLQRSNAGLNIGDVSVQYKVYEEGSDGQWNRLDFTFEEDEDGNILNKKYTCTSSTKNLAAGLSPGKNYVLEIMYQVVDNNGQYYFLKPSKDYGMFKFSVKDGGGGGGESGEGVRGDLDGDGKVGMSDVMFLVNKILNGKFPDE